MKKTYKIDVDCANCANKMEEAAKNTASKIKNFHRRMEEKAGAE